MDASIPSGPASLIGVWFELEFLYCVEKDELDDFTHNFPERLSAIPADANRRDAAALEHMVFQLVKAHDQSAAWQKVQTRYVAESIRRHPLIWEADINTSVGLMDEEFERLRYDNDWRLARIARSHVIPVKLTSPIFPSRTTFTCFPIVDSFCKTLTMLEHQGTPRPAGGDTPYFAFTNATCSLVLHYDIVDPNGQRAYELATLQNLVALWGVNEKMISTLQPPHHRGDRNNQSMSLRTFFPNHDSQSFKDVIYSARNVDELVMSFEPHRSYGHYTRVDLLLQPTGAGNPSRCYSLAFREHQGTLNSKDIRFWISFTAKVVNFCVTAATQRRRLGPRFNMSLKDLLDMLGFRENDYINKRIEEADAQHWSYGVGAWNWA